ncbi:cobalt-precorrin-6A reductase [Conexibacter sp. SYSU D00693]|uniref:cobalt-precorrin-6A reductase n=1 Tax=Conexibacter sp. SYSU D00693 TaxID=2812560 RepID=UPI00196B8957|nr:cobalt-precorrin-6A reductase [Conexibacter sp. SYSU D00693]
MTVLVLGGTAEARELAEALHREGVAVVSALAGRTSAPRLPAGAVRVGGFGGADGLAAFLRDGDVRAVVDATHPFASQITARAAAACGATGTPLLRLERPGWNPAPGDRWRWVDDLEGAARAIPEGARVLLALGRQHVVAFAGVDHAWFLVRAIERPDPPLPPQHDVVLDRGPYDLAAERALLERHAIDLVVTRDAGGAGARAKLDAARELGVAVLVVRRPALPAGLRTVATLDEAVAWVTGPGS